MYVCNGNARIYSREKKETRENTQDKTDRWMKKMDRNPKSSSACELLQQTSNGRSSLVPY